MKMLWRLNWHGVRMIKKYLKKLSNRYFNKEYRTLVFRSNPNRILSPSPNAQIGPVNIPISHIGGQLDIKTAYEWLIENEIYKFRIGGIKHHIPTGKYIVEFYFVYEEDAMAAKLGCI